MKVHCRYPVSAVPRARRTALAVLLVLAMAGLASGRSLYVTPPGGYGTNNPPYTNWADAATNILWAVKAATNAGDEVWITNGTYLLTNTVVVTNPIALRGVGGRPVLDGNAAVRCLILSNALAVADRLVLSNANATLDGLGVLIYHGLATNCVITGCGSGSTAAWGGGARLLNAAAMADCTIAGNATAYAGGGVYMSGQAELRNCVVAQNTCTHASDMGYIGGGIYIRDNVRVIDCTVVSNQIPFSYGGGISAVLGNWTIRNCLITDNSSGQAGSGLAIIDNSFTTTGVVQNCTVARNSSTNYGGLYARHTCNHTFVNTISFSNRSVNGFAQRDYYRLTGVIVSFTNCCLGLTNDIYGTDNFTNNPLFLDVPNGNFRLAPSSPCVNTGSNQEWMEGARDLDGRRRVDRWSRQVDRGAYELTPAGSQIQLR